MSVPILVLATIIGFAAPDGIAALPAAGTDSAGTNTEDGYENVLSDSGAAVTEEPCRAGSPNTACSEDAAKTCLYAGVPPVTPAISLSSQSLSIPCMDFSVALVYTPDGSRFQAITDDPLSACLINWCYGNVMIADHYNQGFSVLYDVDEGETVACIYDGGRLSTYLCVEKISDGYNRGYDLTLADGTRISDIYHSTLIMYTCNAGSDTVTITVWAPFVMPAAEEGKT